MSAVGAPREEDGILAAEFALGLLDRPEHAAAEARFAAEPELAALRDRWLEDLATLLDVPDAEPDPAIWTAIAARLPANDDREAGSAGRSALRLWQGATFAAAAVAAALLVALVTRAPLPPPPVAIARPVAPLVAVLTGAKSKATVAVRIDRASATLTVAPSNLHLAEHVPELWLIPADKTPRAIGVIAANARTTAVAPPVIAALIDAGATLAISVEPAGGSPTGKPTGPVILTGVIAAS